MVSINSRDLYSTIITVSTEKTFLIESLDSGSERSKIWCVVHLYSPVSAQFVRTIKLDYRTAKISIPVSRRLHCTVFIIQTNDCRLWRERKTLRRAI